MINSKWKYSNSIEISEKKIRSGLFKNVIYKMCLEIIYLIHIYIKDLVLKNIQWLICPKTKPN